MIGWTHFVRGRVHHSLKTTMTEYYGEECKNAHLFINIGWTKEVIKFILETHIAEWHHRCDLNSNPAAQVIKIKKCLLKRELCSSR